MNTPSLRREVHVISLRKANKREVRRYGEQAKEADDT
jgi:uncharacterized DUF497 family protein